MLGRGRRRFMAIEFRVGHLDDGVHEDEQNDRAENETHEGGACIGFVFWGHSDKGYLDSSTRTLFITSLGRICFMASSPFTTFPNTVCTPLRCRVFASLSTMKN
jgi:hypothetical protein